MSAPFVLRQLVSDALASPDGVFFADADARSRCWSASDHVSSSQVAVLAKALRTAERLEAELPSGRRMMIGLDEANRVLTARGSVATVAGSRACDELAAASDAAAVVVDEPVTADALALGKGYASSYRAVEPDLVLIVLDGEIEVGARQSSLFPVAGRSFPGENYTAGPCTELSVSARPGDAVHLRWGDECTLSVAGDRAALALRLTIHRPCIGDFLAWLHEELLERPICRGPRPFGLWTSRDAVSEWWLERVRAEVFGALNEKSVPELVADFHHYRNASGFSRRALAGGRPIERSTLVRWTPGAAPRFLDGTVHVGVDSIRGIHPQIFSKLHWAHDTGSAFSCEWMIDDSMCAPESALDCLQQLADVGVIVEVAAE